MEILVGADPEVFVFNKQLNKVVSAHGMVEGTKENPFPVNNGAVQVDGMALEFNIDPAKNMYEFVRNITYVQEQLSNMIGIDRYALLAYPSTTFSQQDMDAAPNNAKELGCEPDFNAWDGGLVNPSPNANSNMRTGAGHIHVGWTEDKDIAELSHMLGAISATKQLDCSLGVQSLLWDSDTDRRSLYGKAGAFRTKPYGAEYRVLSNAWLQSKELIGHVYTVTVKSMEDLMAGVRYFEDENPEPIINEGDVLAAHAMSSRLLEKHGVPMYV